MHELVTRSNEEIKHFTEQKWMSINDRMHISDLTITVKLRDQEMNFDVAEILFEANIPIFKVVMIDHELKFRLDQIVKCRFFEEMIGNKEKEDRSNIINFSSKKRLANIDKPTLIPSSQWAENQEKARRLTNSNVIKGITKSNKSS
jgi:hypothetical protein